jgi:uncharacterized protein
MSGRGGRARAAAWVVLGGVLLGGCAGGGMPLPPLPAPEALAPGSPLLSPTLPAGDAWLRHSLQSGDAAGALRLVSTRSPARPSDRLLRSLQEGLLLHEAGRYAESNRAFAAAEREVDRRFTRSIRRAAGSVLVSDRTLDYLPTRAEEAMIPYYRILNYLALGEQDGALVESRKASAYLAFREGRGSGCREEGLLHYLAGLVFDGAGERNHALVSFRNAERALLACGSAVPRELARDLVRSARALGIDDLAEDAAERHGLGSMDAEAGRGEVVLLLETGWVAHRARVERVVPVFFSDLVDAAGDTVAPSPERVAGLAVARLLSSLPSGSLAASYEAEEGMMTLARHPVPAGTQVLELVKLSWPAYRAAAGTAPRLALRADGADPVEPLLLGDLSVRVVEELDARLPMILARSALRATTRAALSGEARRRANKEGGEEAGRVAGALVNLLGNALEQPDTRSWTLLPERVSIVRLELPGGEHRLRLESEDGTLLDLGTVRIEPGERLIRRERVWRAGVGERKPLTGSPAG